MADKWIQYTGSMHTGSMPTVRFTWPQIFLSKAAMSVLRAEPRGYVTLYLNPDKRELGIKAGGKSEEGGLMLQKTGAVSFAGFLKSFRMDRLEVATMTGRMEGDMLVVPLPKSAGADSRLRG